MDFKQLEVFVAVCKYESFSKAAKELFLTQPTISSHINNLEKELGTVLINRNNKNLTLTKSGEILYEHAILILNDCKKAVYDIREYCGKIEGVIDIACSSIPESYIIPSFLKDFSDQFKDVNFNISHYDSKSAILEILNERISFGFVGSKSKNPQIEYIDLVDDELVLITPSNTVLPNTDGFIDIDLLHSLKFIMRKEGSGTKELIMDKLKSSNFDTDSLHVVAQLESNESIKKSVQSGLGVSFISYISCIDEFNSGKINIYRIKDLVFKRKFYFIYSRKKVLTPLEDKFLMGLYKYFDIRR